MGPRHLAIGGLLLAAAFLLPRLAQPSGEEHPLVGQLLPPLGTLVFEDGSARVPGGGPVLIEFWATWCGPCRRTIPHLNETHEAFGPRGLRIVGVTNEDSRTVAAFRREVPIDYTVAFDPMNEAHRAFGVRAIPTAFLADREGIIVWAGHPLELSRETIEGLL